MISDVRAAIRNGLVSLGQISPPISPLVLKVKSAWALGSPQLVVSYGGNLTFVLAFANDEGASKHAQYITELGARTVVSVKLALPAEPDRARSERRLAERSSIWIWTMVDGVVKPVQKEALSTGGEIKLWLSDLITGNRFRMNLHAPLTGTLDLFAFHFCFSIEGNLWSSG